MIRTMTTLLIDSGNVGIVFVVADVVIGRIFDDVVAGRLFRPYWKLAIDRNSIRLLHAVDRV